MFGYDHPLLITYAFNAVDFSANPDFAIKAPDGKAKGQILEVGVAVTTTFTSTTSPGYVRVGTTADADAYVELDMGTAAATDYRNTQDDTDAIIDGTVGSTQLEVACVSPVGGAPAGVGNVHITVGWYG